MLPSPDKQLGLYGMRNCRVTCHSNHAKGFQCPKHHHNLSGHHAHSGCNTMDVNQLNMNPYTAMGLQQDTKIKADLAATGTVDATLPTSSAIYGQHPRVAFQQAPNLVFPETVHAPSEMIQKLQQLNGGMPAANTMAGPVLQPVAAPPVDALTSQGFLQTNESKLRQELIATKLKLQFYEKQQREAQRKQHFLQVQQQQQQQHDKLAAYHNNALLPGLQTHPAAPRRPPISTFQHVSHQPVLSQQEQLLMSLRNDPSLQASFPKVPNIPQPTPVIPQPVELSQLQQLAHQKRLQQQQQHQQQQQQHQQSNHVPANGSENLINVSFNPNNKHMFAPASATPSSLSKLSNDPNAVAFMQSVLASKQRRSQILPQHPLGSVFTSPEARSQSSKRSLTGPPKPVRKKASLENNKGTSKASDTINIPSALTEHSVSPKNLLHALTLEIVKVLQKKSQLKNPEPVQPRYQCVLEAIKKGEFKELSEKEVKSYCCQSSETCMLNDDDLMDDSQLNAKSDEIDAIHPDGEKLASPQQLDEVVESSNASCPEEHTTITADSLPPLSLTNKSRGRPRKGPVAVKKNPRQLPELKAKPLKIRLTDLKKDAKLEPVPPPPPLSSCNGQCNVQSTIKQESFENIYIKQEPIETENYFKSETETKSGNIGNTTIANQIMGNIQQMFMMLQKDSDDDDNIDVNSFLTNS